jgi:hypothetical protein
LVEAIIAPYQHDLANGRNAHAAGRAIFDAITESAPAASLRLAELLRRPRPQPMAEDFPAG